MGIIVLAVAILPVLGVGGRQLFMAETPGPMKDSQLSPRITETAKNLWLVYGSITVACIFALKWAGMPWLDAVRHPFATLSLGGYSTYDAGVDHFNSPAIEAVFIVFMPLAGMNFATHFRLHRHIALFGDWEVPKGFAKNGDATVMADLPTFKRGSAPWPCFLAASRYLRR